MPVDLFNGEFGALVKNGKFHLKAKSNRLHYIMGYKLCPNIMYGNGYESEDSRARRCRDRIIDNNFGANKKEIQALFTKAMKDVKFSDLSKQFSEDFDDKYIQKHGMAEISDGIFGEIGGVFILTPEVYAFIDPRVNYGILKDDKIIIKRKFSYHGYYIDSGPKIAVSRNTVPKSVLRNSIQKANTRF